MGLTFKKMNLFDAPKGSILVHACNASGAWGAGIALQFKDKFPKSFEEYREHCFGHDEPIPMFPAVICQEENGHRVGCLLTAQRYGRHLEPIHDIIANTHNALLYFNELMIRYGINKDTPIYSNKFNSGLFKVPWIETENVLHRAVDWYGLNWIVCDPDLKD